MSALSSFFIGLLLVVASLASSSAEAQRTFVPPVPEDPDQVDVYLLTVGRGDQVHAIYGHTFLRVVDRAQGLDMNFNWGMFDFNGPGFIWNFYTGNMMYWMGVADLQSTIEHYRRYERRSVTQERINLTAAQKMTLVRRVIWNAQPENVRYRYSQLFDNCATKPRNYLDEALGGKLKERFNAEPSPWTFRHYIRAGSIPLWWAYLGLDQMTNEVHDQRITPWQEMFLPARLRTILKDMPALDDTGSPIPGQMLLSDTQVLVDLPEPVDGPDPYHLVALAFGIPMLLGLLGLLRSGREVVQARILGLLGITYGSWCGFWGTAYTFNWVTAGYAEGLHNAGLLLMLPVDWLFAFVGLVMIIRGRRPTAPVWSERLAKVHIVGFFVLLLAQIFGLVKQDTVGMLASTGVLGLLFYVLILCHGAAKEPA